ncbi:Golgi CORVET complex core vacuolar protein 8-domain-containing protein [Elsinoe ampelina]|uniref:Golgi CORVET complex core vacuolar protein 8-domain-containing protein n=1 Tax=Elsinoe ampelina TaxID=302913 RepID=A0A6A6GGW1_9PEZI|nr:Golgi CORVET complex core vacuolar protein 8-domain-containing protein [Elsinoe ampelina]
MSISGGTAGGGSDEDVEADKSQRTSESRTNGIDHLPEEPLDPEEVDDILPTIEDGPPDDIEADDGEDDVESVVQGERLDTVLRTPSIPGTPADSGSIPDDTPSLKGSQVSLPLRGTPSPRGSASRTASGAIKPFERRFQSRFSISPSPSRTASPAFLNVHSRQSSTSSYLPSQHGDASEVPQAPWEVVRWTKLRKISGQAFSEIGKRQLGSPTCLAVSASIVVGTSKGLILVFDYHQNLKGIIGQGTKATESGAITSLAISADYSTVAGGHASGNIFTWEIARPAKPFLWIPAVTQADRESETEGHIVDRSVLHIGFLGTRHTALVSADDGGMAFSHLANRGFGAMGRSVKTTRLLGRYPTFKPEEDKLRKPSSVLAFSPLPLGNVEQATDTMGLTALLTPYLLVVVSTTPIAQTQHKASRPKDIMPHGAMSACLAWFPAVKLKAPSNGKDASDTKLVYCWSDVMTVLDVEIGPLDPNDKEKQPSLFFKTRSRWKCEEAIVAVQWLSRSVIGALTISQRLVILEDGDLHVMDSVDLIKMHIFHRDFFSKQLHTVVEQNENDADIHGVVADAFYMSFRAYKGRAFLLGFSDVSVGTLSNWADRLSALVEHGDDIAAIQLAIAYYKGSTGKVSVGLPDDDASRHEMVRERLLELLQASLKYRFSDKEIEDDRVHDLTNECFNACLAMDETDFLLDDAYDYFKEGRETEIFIDTLEHYIMEGDIKSLPPLLVKDVVDYYASIHREARLEEILCRLEAHAFDIDQVTKLCKQHLLYDALIYVWNQALEDWITPLAELCALIRVQNLSNGTAAYDHEDRLDAAMKIFPYLAFSLTGRLYPKGDPMDDEQADAVRQDMYKMLFSAHIITWPPGSKTKIRTVEELEEEPAFPYLRLLLHFDTPNFMSMMNEAFEDPYLNSNQDQDYDETPTTPVNGSMYKMTRQQIISILLETMSASDFEPSQTIYLDMFIARSLPKYPQFLILSGSALQQILRRLCSNDDDDLSDECQLSVEYLLSVYHPPVTDDFIKALQHARFYRVLKSTYRSERRYVELIATFLEDPDDRLDVFQDIELSFRTETGAKQRQAIEDIICARAQELIFIDLSQTTQLVVKHMSSRIDDLIESLKESRLQHAFLQELLEPDAKQMSRTDVQAPKELVGKFSDRYIQLMCIHNPTHVADFVTTLESGDLHLDAVLPVIEKYGVIDAAVLLLTKDGLAREAMDRLEKHLQSLSNALASLISSSTTSPDVFGLEVGIKDLLADIDKYTKLGIWLCTGQSQIASQTPSPTRRDPSSITENTLTLDEYLWLTLISLTVNISKLISSSCNTLPSPLPTNPPVRLRSLVQQVFTALLTATTSPTKPASSNPPHPAPLKPGTSFLPIFRLFLTRAALSAPSLTDLRHVLLDIFSAYAYETDVLALASQLLGADAFSEVHAAHAKRQQGWGRGAQGVFG